MTFAAPSLLIALGLLVPVLIAFLVRRRREAVRVPSTLLFRLAARTTVQSRKIRWLRRLASLAACVAAVAALVLAAARPTPRSQGKTTAIVVDVSASMAAGGSGSPLEQARRFARQLIRSAGPADRFAILAAGRVPVRLEGPVEPGPALDEAVDQLAVETGAADREAAVELAASLLAGAPGARVVLLHDRGESLGDSYSRDADAVLTERVFTPPASENVGITALATRPPVDAAADDEREALISVATSSNRVRAARVIVSADGHEIARRAVAIPALGEAELRVRVRAAAGRLTARIEPDDGIADALALDDEATLSESSPRSPRVLFITDTGAGDAGDDANAFFVEKALQAAGVREIVNVNPGLEGHVQSPGDIVVALDRGPSRPLDVPALYLGTHTGTIPVQGLVPLGADKTHLRSLASTDAILRGVALDGLTIAQATAAEVPPGARSLVELDGGSVVLAGGAGQSAWVYLGIEPTRSDLVLKVAFPVLVANALSTLGGSSNVAVAETVARSEVALRAASSGEGITAPDEPDAARRLPASPAMILAALAAILLAAEAWTFRKGWAE